jgi:Mn2+/Fe2+ NRAMP family transporter
VIVANLAIAITEFVGIRSGTKMELYIWSLIVAVLIFGLGGGVSFHEGVQHIRQPQPLHGPS